MRDVVADEAVASADMASSAEGRGAGTCRSEPQGQLWASRYGRGRGGGGGGGSRGCRCGEGHKMATEDVWLCGCGRAGRLRRMLLRMLLRPDGFTGCLLRTVLWGGE